LQFGDDEIGVVRAGLVIVGENNDIGVFERRRQFIRPLSGAHRVGCRTRAKCDQRVRAFLAFGDENDFTCGYGIYKIMQPIWYLPDTFYIVDILSIYLVPLTVGFDRPAVRAGLAILEAADLE
jgi:hypothetical protein